MPFLDKDGLLCVGGRAKKSLALTDQEKHPIIIPKASQIATLLASYFHQRVHPQGQTTTIGALRGYGFWIIGVNKTVKSVIRKCVPCQAMRGLPMTQLMGNFSQTRVEPSPPFTHIGIDCSGPYTAQTLGSTYHMYVLKSCTDRNIGVYENRCLPLCAEVLHMYKRSS